MRIRVNDPTHTDALVAYLGMRPDVVVARVGIDELEAQLLGSYRIEAMRDQLDVRLRCWLSSQRAAGATVEANLL